MLRAGKLVDAIIKDYAWLANLDECYDIANGMYISKDFLIIVLDDCCLAWKYHLTMNEELCKIYFQIHSESDNCLHALKILPQL